MAFYIFGDYPAKLAHGAVQALPDAGLV